MKKKTDISRQLDNIINQIRDLYKERDKIEKLCVEEELEKLFKDKSKKFACDFNISENKGNINISSDVLFKNDIVLYKGKVFGMNFDIDNFSDKELYIRGSLKDIKKLVSKYGLKVKISD